MSEVAVLPPIATPNADLLGMTLAEWKQFQIAAPAPVQRLQQSAQSIVNNTTTLITWVTNSYSDSRFFNAGVFTAHRFTAPATGFASIVELYAEILWAGPAAPVGERVAIMFAGATQIAVDLRMADTVANAASSNTMITEAVVASGTTVDFSIQVRHTQGVNLAIVSDGRTNFHCKYLGQQPT